MKGRYKRREDGQTLVTPFQEEGKRRARVDEMEGATGARARTLKPFLQKAL